MKNTYSKVLFLTDLSKTLLGVFNTIYLYKMGFSYIEILLWQTIVYIIYLVLPIQTLKLGNRIGHKKIFMISGALFILTYLYLNFCVVDVISVCIYGLLFGIFGSFYWMPRHYFGFKEIKGNKVGKKVGIFLIISQLTTIVSSIISAFVLENFTLAALIVISFTFMIMAMYCMRFLPDNDYTEEVKPQKFFQEMPKQTLFHIFLKEGSQIVRCFFALYLFIYIDNSYSFAGIVNILLGIAGIIFTYFISKRIDDKRNDYLLLSVVLLCLGYLAKLNITSGIIILLVVFSEGIIKQFYGSVSDANFYTAGNKSKNLSFIAGHELFLNISRVTILLVGLFLLQDFTKFMYFCIGLTVLSGFVSYKVPQEKTS